MTLKVGVFALLVLSALVSFNVTLGQTVGCEDGFHTITDATGEKCLPDNPQQVVVLEWTYVEDLLALGVQPVGVADIEGYNNWVKIPVLLDTDVADVGTRQEPNLELITELNPDLIIAISFRVTQNYDDLSAIAPTLVFDPYPADGSSHYEEMTNTLAMIAGILNREAQAEAVMADLQDYYDQAKAALESAGRDGEAFILSQGWVYETVATFRLFTDNATAVQILERIGLNNAWDDAPQQYGYTEIGIEGFVEIADQDFNFFYVAQDADNVTFAGSPLWNSLPFVQAERDHWIGGDVWLFGGPLSAKLLVETVLDYMGVEIPAAEARPEATAVA